MADLLMHTLRGVTLFRCNNKIKHCSTENEKQAHILPMNRKDDQNIMTLII